MRQNFRLDELGERAIIDQILRPRYGLEVIGRFGDDCAHLLKTDSIKSGLLVATTDPCPEPMATFLGYNNLYYHGWLLATINLSDLAATGARPLGVLTSLILRNETTINQFERLLDGIDDCCRESGTRVIGGNLKEGPKINLSATAIGICNPEAYLSRVGCRKGDLIVIIGDIGLFWAGVLSEQRGLELSDNQKATLLRNILKPLPKVHIGQEIASKGLLTSCMDNSDGLYPSLVQLAKANKLQMFVKMDSVAFPGEVATVSSALAVDPIRLALGWGDWQLVGCCDSSKKQELEEVAKRHDTPIHVIGEVRSGQGVVLEHNGRTAEMAPIDSQRFTRDSWFTVGIEGYIDLLVNGSLWQE